MSVKPITTQSCNTQSCNNTKYCDYNNAIINHFSGACKPGYDAYDYQELIFDGVIIIPNFVGTHGSYGGYTYEKKNQFGVTDYLPDFVRPGYPQCKGEYRKYFCVTRS